MGKKNFRLFSVRNSKVDMTNLSFNFTGIDSRFQFLEAENSQIMFG